jgi:hypothetical protein
MALQWLVNLTGGCGNFFAKSVSPWQSGHHRLHSIAPKSEGQVALEFQQIKAHGYFSIMVDERHSLGRGSTMPCNIHWLFVKLGSKDDKPDLFQTLGHVLPGSFPLSIALMRVDGLRSMVVLSLTFEAVQVRNFLPVANGYIFDFMVAGKAHEDFLQE